MKHKKLKILLVAVMVLCVIGWVYVSDYYHADETAVAAMSAASGFSMQQEGNFTAFVPEQAGTGFIFYPGGKVEYSAYAPLMRALAGEGVLCVAIEMPWNLAVLNIDAAESIPARFPQVERWYIGGHSLGGSMAACHAAKNSGDYAGLVLLAAYSTNDLSTSGLPVISVYGSEDGVLNLEKYAAERINLPADFEEHIIEGGCHAGFGSYGIQKGDGVPTISGAEQVAQTAYLLKGFFN